MTKFSANLGFLWTELSLPDATRAAKNAGFAAVECHWPYETPHAAVEQALAETGPSLLGLNTVHGDAAAGDFGLGSEHKPLSSTAEGLGWTQTLVAPQA